MSKYNLEVQSTKYKVQKYKGQSPKTKVQSPLYSSEILNAAAVAHGAKMNDIASIAPSR